MVLKASFSPGFQPHLSDAVFYDTATIHDVVVECRSVLVFGFHEPAVFPHVVLFYGISIVVVFYDEHYLA